MHIEVSFRGLYSWMCMIKFYVAFQLRIHSHSIEIFIIIIIRLYYNITNNDIHEFVHNL